jgi:hypothetical protein
MRCACGTRAALLLCQTRADCCHRHPTHAHRAANKTHSCFFVVVDFVFVFVVFLTFVIATIAVYTRTDTRKAAAPTRCRSRSRTPSLALPWHWSKGMKQRAGGRASERAFCTDSFRLLGVLGLGALVLVKHEANTREDQPSAPSVARRHGHRSSHPKNLARLVGNAVVHVLLVPAVGASLVTRSGFSIVDHEQKARLNHSTAHKRAVRCPIGVCSIAPRSKRNERERAMLGLGFWFWFEFWFGVVQVSGTILSTEVGAVFRHRTPT